MPDNFDSIPDALSRRIARDGEYRRLFLRDLVVQVYIGIYPHELDRTQRVSVDVDLYLLPPKEPLKDRIENVLDYDFILAEVETLTRDRHINLQETLADSLADICLLRAQVWGVRVATTKLDVYENCGGVGYEIFRMKTP